MRTLHMRRTWRACGIAAGAAALLALFVAVPAGIAQSDTPTPKALILSTTVTDGASSIEAQTAVALGMTVDVKTPTEWDAMTAAQFAEYRLIILGDPTCQTGTAAVAAAETNAGVWGPAVDGNVVVMGNDPTFHYTYGPTAGATALIQRSMAFAADAAGKTGAYISLSCYYHYQSTPTMAAVLAGLGTFWVQGTVYGFNAVHIVATHPALLGLTDADLSNWYNSVHEMFVTSWPASFQVLAIATDQPGGPYTSADGTTGYPFILARGEGLSASDIQLSPASADVLINTPHTLKALVSYGGVPQSGATVTFGKLGGPSDGIDGFTAVTGADGTASYTFTSAIEGVDTWQASFARAGTMQFSNTATINWAAPADEPPSISADASAVTVAEGTLATNTGMFGDPDGDAVTLSASVGAVVANQDGTWSWSWTSSDGPADGQTVIMSATANGLTAVTPFDLVVENVPPTVTSLTPNVSSAIEGQVVTFTGTATDPSIQDTTAGFQWSLDGVTFGKPLTASFDSCGTHYVTGYAMDKDNGVSDPFQSSAVTVADGQFLPPLNPGEYNRVQSGRVLPVKVNVGCGGVFQADLHPAIKLLTGDVDPSTDTGDGSLDVPTVSVSSADTTGVMRLADGLYIYNLQIPTAKAGTLYTVRVEPFGTAAGGSMYIVLQIKK